MSSNDPLVEQCKNAGYHVEYQRGFDGKTDFTTSVVSFPCFAGEDTIIASDVNALRQLDFVQTLQTEWADNAVSCTVYYKPEEIADIQAWLARNYETGIKSVSFLLHTEHGFEQAPYEEIDVETYRAMVTQMLDLEMYNAGEMLSLEECENGVCPIR
jgi:ribonucleoside-triphosphate reductase